MQKDDFLDKDSFYSQTGFEVTSRAKDFLITAAFWGKILSIIGFVFTAFMVLVGIVMLFMGSIFSQVGGKMGDLGAWGGIGVSILYLLFSLVYFFPSLYLFNFSKKTQLAIHNSDSLELEESFKNLKFLFMFLGISIIAIVALYFVIVIFAVVIGGTNV